MARFNYIHGNFTGKGNINISYQGWSVDKPRVIVILVHGLGEHSGRYMNIIGALAGKAVSFYGIDHRGHGRSDGLKGHVDSFMDYVYDLKAFVNMVKDENRDLPIIMLGHSLGGAIACRYALTYQNDLSGLILSSVGLIPVLQIPAVKKAMATVLSGVAPSMTMKNGLTPEFLSHDENTVKNYINDPLVHGLASSRFYTEFIANGKFCLEYANQIRLPLLLIHGEADKFIDVDGSRKVYDSAESNDKQLIIFPGLYHETMNETSKERNKVLDLVSKWILAHIKDSPKGKGALKKTPVKKKSTDKKTKISPETHPHIIKKVSKKVAKVK